MDCETGWTGESAARDQTPQQRYVGVVRAEEALVDGLEQAPCGRGDGTGERWVGASPHQVEIHNGPSALDREKSVEERAIALKRNAKVLSRDFVTAIPLILQPISLFGE